MLKKLASVVSVLLALVFVCSAQAGASELTEEENRLFEMQGESYIKRNPYGSDGSSENSPSQPLLVLGKDMMVTSSDGKYPLNVNNSSQKPAYYYIAGSNSLELLVQRPDLIDYLDGDYVVEYDLNYADNTEGHVSIALNFNYSYYIDAYLNADGTGDIVICVGGEYYSLLAQESLLGPQSGESLKKALYGEDGNAEDKNINIAVRVTSDENKMPERIDMYVNGLLAASADAEKLAYYTQRYTPEYEIGQSGAFPSDKLGNIIVLKCTVGIRATVDNIRIYSVPDSATSPLESSQRIYSQVYGNISYSPSGEDESNSEENEGENNESESDQGGHNMSDSDKSAKDSNALIYALAVFAVLDIAIIAAVVILLKRRTKSK